MLLTPGFFCLVLLHGAVVTKADGSGLNLQYFVKRLEGGAWAVKEPHRGLTIEGAFAALDTDHDGLVAGNELRRLFDYIKTRQTSPAVDDTGPPTDVEALASAQTTREMPDKARGSAKHEMRLDEPDKQPDQDPEPITSPMAFADFKGRFGPRLGQRSAAELPGLFSVLDVSQDGRLDGPELVGLIERIEHHAQALSDLSSNGRRVTPASTPPPAVSSLSAFEDEYGGALAAAGADTLAVFHRLDIDGDGKLCPAEMTSYKSLVFTGRTEQERSHEAAHHGHPSEFVPAVDSLPDLLAYDLNFETFEARYGSYVKGGGMPHGHHKAFVAMDKNLDNLIQPHELNALARWIRTHVGDRKEL